MPQGGQHVLQPERGRPAHAARRSSVNRGLAPRFFHCLPPNSQAGAELSLLMQIKERISGLA
jgi:hypothetical protein